MKDKNKDLFLALKEEGITGALESEALKIAITKLVGLLTSEATAALVGSILSAAAPRIQGVFLTYKQLRFERNMKKMVETLTNRVTDLENNYLMLNSETQEKFRGVYVEMLLDNVVDERQEEKIGWNVNGFINMMDENSNEDIMQIFFDTLQELTVLDVDTLRMYIRESDINYRDIEEKYNINGDQLKMIKEKLVRFGLLFRKNDSIRDKNIDEISDYLKRVSTESKKNKPNSVMFPNAVKKIGSTESYGITYTGRSFLKCIGEEKDL